MCSLCLPATLFSLPLCEDTLPLSLAVPQARLLELPLGADFLLKCGPLGSPQGSEGRRPALSGERPALNLLLAASASFFPDFQIKFSI